MSCIWCLISYITHFLSSTGKKCRGHSEILSSPVLGKLFAFFHFYDILSTTNLTIECWCIQCIHFDTNLLPETLVCRRIYNIKMVNREWAPTSVFNGQEQWTEVFIFDKSKLTSIYWLLNNFMLEFNVLHITVLSHAVLCVFRIRKHRLKFLNVPISKLTKLHCAEYELSVKYRVQKYKAISQLWNY